MSDCRNVNIIFIVLSYKRSSSESRGRFKDVGLGGPAFCVDINEFGTFVLSRDTCRVQLMYIRAE